MKTLFENTDHIKEPLQNVIHKFKNHPSIQLINKKSRSVKFAFWLISHNYRGVSSA